MFMRPLLVTILLLAACPAPEAADSMRCGSRIISVEARAAEVLAACGEPDFRDVLSYSGQGLPNEWSESEQWTYNFGSNKLLHVLKLRRGRLIDIETDGFGFPRGEQGCAPSSVVDGLSKYRLLERCGEPLTSRQIGVISTFKPRHQRQYGGWSTSRGLYSAEVFREEWVYNFGSRYFLKVVTLEDGRVSDVKNGERGFDPR